MKLREICTFMSFQQHFRTFISWSGIHFPIYPLHSWLVAQKFKLKPSFTCWVSVSFNRVTKLPSRDFFLYQSSFLSTNWKGNWKKKKKRKRQWDAGQSTWLGKAYCFNMAQGKEHRTTVNYAILVHSSEEVALLASVSAMELDSILKCYSLGKRCLGWWGW